MQKELFENELKAERASNEEMTRKLNEKISNFEAKFVDLNEFIEKKDSLHAELKEAQDRLIKEQKEHTVIVNDLERKAVQEKERLRKEMLAKIKEAKNQFMKMTGNRHVAQYSCMLLVLLYDGDGQQAGSDDQADDHGERANELGARVSGVFTRARRAHAVHVLSSELAFQSREAEKLLHKNEQLTLENKTMKRDLELYRQMEKELAKRNNAYLKTIRTLLSKLKALDATKKDILETGKRKEADILDLYQSQIANISMNLDESTMELDELRTKYADSSEKLKQITSMHDEVMRFMIQARFRAAQMLLRADVNVARHWTDRTHQQCHSLCCLRYFLRDCSAVHAVRRGRESVRTSMHDMLQRRATPYNRACSASRTRRSRCPSRAPMPTG